jgi:tetratricopeptide (TPR) repeat protein
MAQPAEKIFLASVQAELAAFREPARSVIEKLGYKCVCMEDFPADSRGVPTFLAETIRHCHCVILIAGHCFGSAPRTDDRSYTQLEYDAAVAAGVPTLVFVSREDFSVPANLRERDELWLKQVTFRRYLLEHKTALRFGDAHELESGIFQSIRAWEQGRSAGPLTIPPDPEIVHPFPVQNYFSGRRVERTRLSQWLADDRRAVLAMTGMGGLGKTAVVWAWLHHDILGQQLPGSLGRRIRIRQAATPDGIFWWSFYEHSASFDQFATRALRYVAGDRGIGTTALSVEQTVERLLGYLRRYKYLLVLNGFERELHAYADPLPDPRRFRSCWTEPARKFLEAVACDPLLRSKILLTSRLLPAELESAQSVHREELSVLASNDAVRMCRAYGVRRSEAEILRACRSCGFLPLALRLLAGLMTGGRRVPDPLSVVEPKLLGHRGNHVLQQAYDALDDRQRDLLRRIAAAGVPICHETLAGSAGELERARTLEDLSELKRRGLVLFDKRLKRYHLHTVVIKYVKDRPSDKVSNARRVHDYYAVTQSPEDIQKMEDLSPHLELYRMHILAGQYEDACLLFVNNISDALIRFGDYRRHMQLLRELVPEAEAPRLRNENYLAWVLYALATSYERVGECRTAVDLLKRQTAIRERLQEHENLLMGLIKLSSNYIRLGELRKSWDTLHHALPLTAFVKSRVPEGTVRRELGLLLLYLGDPMAAGQELGRANRLFKDDNELGAMGTVSARLALRSLFLPNRLGVLAAETALERARAECGGTDRDLIRAEWLVAATKLAFGTADQLSEAGSHIKAAWDGSARVQMFDLQPDILLTRAKIHHARGHSEEALRDAQDALTIAERYDFRLNQAEAHNFLGRLEAEAGRFQRSRDHAEIARARALCDGEPFVYRAALEDAESLLVVRVSAEYPIVLRSSAPLRPSDSG